jgi:hypothetical protein
MKQKAGCACSETGRAFTPAALAWHQLLLLFPCPANHQPRFWPGNGARLVESWGCINTPIPSLQHSAEPTTSHMILRFCFVLSQI